MPAVGVASSVMTRQSFVESCATYSALCSPVEFSHSITIQFLFVCACSVILKMPHARSSTPASVDQRVSNVVAIGAFNGLIKTLFFEARRSRRFVGNNYRKSNVLCPPVHV